MNEAAGMSQSMPLYLIVAGGVLILALIFVVLKMRRGKEEEEGAAAPVAQSAPPPRKKPEAPAPEPEASKVEEEAAVAEPEPAAAESGGLTVQREPFIATPDVDRGSFEAFAGKKVLVVEDNPVNRKLILTLMAGTGIDLDSAEDGVEALEKLRKPGGGFDLVLMDVNMPRMDGLECTRQIRQDPALREIPVLALTASTTPEEVEAILESGMNGYLDKPLELGKLYTAFVKFMQDYRVPAGEGSSEGSTVETDREVLDLSVGLEHTNEDAGLYRMLLEDFLQQYADSPQKLHDRVAASDYDGIHRMMIDLEGLSGALGAMRLYQLSLEINEVLERKATMLLKDYADEYAEAYRRFETEARRYLAG
jgi:CheY-like chemotaxis protein